MGSHERAHKTEEDNVIYQRCQYAYEFAIPYIENKNVLDIGCGLGYGTASMAKYASHITGIDYDEKTIIQNNNTYNSIKNITFKSSKVPPLPFSDNTFEVITAFQFIEHIAAQEMFLKECLRVLVPNGKLLVTTPNTKKSFARNPFHIKEYTFKEMEDHIKPITPNFELLGLQGNDKVNSYYKANQKVVNKILKWDIFNLHKIIPAKWVAIPYNIITTTMRKKLKKNISITTEVSTKDFFLQKVNLEDTWDIYLIAQK